MSGAAQLGHKVQKKANRARRVAIRGKGDARDC